MSDERKESGGAMAYARQQTKSELLAIDSELQTLTNLSVNEPTLFGPVQALRDHVRRLREHIRTILGE
jgi:hypothetical protein